MSPTIERQVDAVRLALLDEPRDFAKARALVPAGDASTMRCPQLVLVKNESLVVPGDLHVAGPLLLELGSCLYVLGSCVVDGFVYSPGLQYSLFMVRGTLRARTILTAGEVFALEGLSADVLIGQYNDHSTYAPTIECQKYLACDRYDVFDELHAAQSFTNPDAFENELEHLFPQVYPRRADEDDRAFERREYAYFTAGLKPQQPVPVTEAEADHLRRGLQSADVSVWREALQAIRRKHAVDFAADIAARVRADVANRGEFLDVLGALKATDALRALISGPTAVAFGRLTSVAARACENAGAEVRTEHRDGQWYFFVRFETDAPWLLVA